jgi:spore coat protein U-like protein
MEKRSAVIIASVAALLGSLAAPLSAFAAAKSQNMPVQAQVNVNCNFSSTPTMNFGVYDNTVATDHPGSIGVSVRCTSGAVTTIGISTGNNSGSAPSGSTRAMKHATLNNYLGYDLYHESTHTTVWTTSGGGLQNHTSTSNTPATINIYGKIPQLQDVPAGTYNDVVVVTINY